MASKMASKKAKERTQKKVSSSSSSSSSLSSKTSSTPPCPQPISLDDFVAKMLPLIDLEKEAEITASMDSLGANKLETSQKHGRALLNLKCTDVEAGLLGKSLLELHPNRGDLLPPHKFSPHDVVILKPNKAETAVAPLVQGVVYRVKDSCIIVAVDDMPEEGLNSPLRLEKVANEVTYQRYKNTLQLLSKGVPSGPAVDLIAVLFGTKPPSFSKSLPNLSLFNKGLDASQLEAVKKALGSNPVMLLHGPPGTGKTTAVVEIIMQEVKRGSKVLACAASNIAVDNMVERLSCYKVNLVRMGHPARLLPQILEKSLDAQSGITNQAVAEERCKVFSEITDGATHPCIALVMKADNSAIANDVRKEMKALNSKLLKAKDKRGRGEIQRELRILAKEERKRQQQAVNDVIKDSNIILTTLTGAQSQQLQYVSFDVVIIDEGAQALEVACWIALLKGSRCILAGDHLQLAPTIQSVDAEKKGLGMTLFARLAALYSDAMAMLTIQYRMNRLIMDWSSQELYDSKIEAHASVAEHTLCDLEGVKASPASEPILVLIDTTGCDMEEKVNEESSVMNEGEAKVALAHVKKLVESGVMSADIGIITPYAAQVGLLKLLRNEERLLKDVEISTVDGFQGREKEAIVISMVRSNDKHEVGFLSDNRRMNVAVTRARRQCCIICDTETVKSDNFLKRLVEYFEKHGEYLSASQFTD